MTEARIGGFGFVAWLAGSLFRQARCAIAGCREYPLTEQPQVILACYRCRSVRIPNLQGGHRGK